MSIVEEPGPKLMFIILKLETFERINASTPLQHGWAIRYNLSYPLLKRDEREFHYYPSHD
jgi:hypothetical protein